MQETPVRSLGGKDPLEKGRATHPSILAWRIPWTEEPGGLQSMRSQRVGHDGATNPSKPVTALVVSRNLLEECAWNPKYNTEAELLHMEL